MTDNVQYSVNGWSAAIELCAVASWPARETLALDGWFLRFTGGFSSRSNSAATNAYNGASLECSIEAVEAAYRARGLPPQFQIAPTTRPENLEAVLVARGYTHKTPTWVMVAETAALAAPSTPGQGSKMLTGTSTMSRNNLSAISRKSAVALDSYADRWLKCPRT
jgi:hypothetical protein